MEWSQPIFKVKLLLQPMEGLVWPHSMELAWVISIHASSHHRAWGCLINAPRPSSTLQVCSGEGFASLSWEDPVLMDPCSSPGLANLLGCVPGALFLVQGFTWAPAGAWALSGKSPPQGKGFNDFFLLQPAKKIPN